MPGSGGRGRRWLSTLKKKATDATANAVVQALAWIVTSLILPYLSSKYGPDWVGGSLTASLRVPSWILVSGALFIAGVAVIIFARFRRRKREASALQAQIATLTADIERREWQAKTFPWGGVAWPLLDNFWGIVRSTSAEDFVGGVVAPSQLNTSIGDPLCGNPKCRQEIWPYAASGMCVCGSRFQLGLTKMGRIPPETRLELKRAVYGAARAEYFRRQLSPPLAG